MPALHPSDAEPLTAEEERRLMEAWRSRGCLRSRDKVILAYEPLARRIARSFRRSSRDMDDILAEVRAGFVRAAETFDPEQGWRFSTYAMHWGRAAVQDYMRRTNGPLSVSQSHSTKKVAAALARKGGAELLEGPYADEVARSLGMEPARMREIVFGLRATAVSLDTPSPFAEDGESLGARIPDDTLRRADEILSEQEEAERRSAWLREGMRELNERERDILISRFLSENPENLQELGDRYGISKERIRQLEARAVEVVSRHVRRMAGLPPRETSPLSAARTSRNPVSRKPIAA